MHYDDFKDSSYELQSWLTILRGMRLINPEIVIEYLEKNNMKGIVSKYLEFQKNMEDAATKCISHKKFVERVSL
jgi:hypothetical protein